MKTLIKNLLAALLIWGCGASRNLPAATDSPVLATLDLTAVTDDRVPVAIDPGTFAEGPVRFNIPKTVPGTYSEDNYGRYVDDLVAYDYKGSPLAVTREGQNSWLIPDGASLDRISYRVNDSYDSEGGNEEAPFSPAGTNILENTHFMLNLHGFVGYFEGLMEQPYQLTIKAPGGLHPTTSLRGSLVQDGSWTYQAGRYFDVIDNPIQFSSEAPASFQVGDITVGLSVYSPNNVYSVATFKPAMERMMRAQKAFLGDIDGTKEYNIILYLSDMGKSDAIGFGALEHHTSTVVVLPENLSAELLEETMIDVVSHEFFHIVTPLNVHSEEIQYFDYNDPKMSEHLWMYEGTTEYFANLFQVQQDLIPEEDFYARLVGKIRNSHQYPDDMSFTEMSRNILDEPYSVAYANVYEKGALINMVLDIRLRELSGGAYGVRDLMKELSAKYDQNTPFRDPELIDEIVALTYPEIRGFFDAHVIGGTPIDYNTELARVGLRFGDVDVASGFFLTDFENQIPYIDADPEEMDRIFIREGIELNTFFTALGAEGGDVIKEINGMEINLEGMRSIIGQSLGWGPETEVKMVVERNGESLVLEGKAGNPTVTETRIAPDPAATPKQEALRRAWLKG